MSTGLVPMQQGTARSQEAPMTDAELAYRRDEAARRYRSTRRTTEVLTSVGLISAISIVGLLWAPFFLLGAAASGLMARRQKDRLDALLAA